MKLAALLLLVACSSAPKSPEPTTPAGDTTSSPVATPPAAAPPAAASRPAPTTPSAAATPASASKASYSCFSYVSKNSTVKRHACMRTDDCGPYLEQAKSVGGIRDVSGCANVASVYCFHQVATKDEPEGLDVCQPSLDECKTARADAVKSKMSVDTDCAQR